MLEQGGTGVNLKKYLLHYRLRVVVLGETGFGIFLSTGYSWESNRDLTLEAERLVTTPFI